jgi:RNA polymerase sigma factor for flagellar operon FliA
MTLQDPKNREKLNHFIAEYAPLIQKRINVLRSKGKIPAHIEHEDLYEPGMMGLMHALHKYDDSIAQTAVKEGENPFAKYAEKWINGKILDHISTQDQVPKSLRTRAKNLERMGAQQPVQPAQPTQPSPEDSSEES